MHRRSSRISQREQRALQLAQQKEDDAIRGFLDAALADDAPDWPACFDLFDFCGVGVLPLPLPAPEEQEDFDLPKQWTKQTAQYHFRSLKQNQYRGGLQRPALSAEKIPACACKPGAGCDENCVNRGLFMECPTGRCHATPEGAYDCGNSRLQLRQFADVEVFETSNRGFGLRAKQALARGDLISEYLGEVITFSECMARMKAMEATDDFYFAGLGGGFILDARFMGSEARFANHSCDPNAELQKWNVLGEPRIALVAIRDIEEGEEVTYNYNYHMDGLEEQLMRQTCRCGSRSCSGVIGGKVKLSARDKWIERAEFLLSAQTERAIRLDQVKSHISRSEQLGDQIPENHPSVVALKQLCESVAEWQATIRKRFQQTAVELTVAEVETMLQAAAGKPRTDEHAMLQKVLDKHKQLTKQIGAVFQQVMGIPLPAGAALEATAARKHEQQLHWDYALQLVKELEGVLPLRIETARVILDWILRSCQPAVKTFAHALAADVELQRSETGALQMITTVLTAYGRDPAPVRQCMGIAEALQVRIDMLLRREWALELPKNQDSRQWDQEGGDPSDEDKLYCFCRLPEQSSNEGTMVQCGDCKEWYHPECMGIQEKDIPRNVELMCPLCAHMERMPCSLSCVQLVPWRYQKQKYATKTAPKAQPRAQVQLQQPQSQAQSQSQLFPSYLLAVHELATLEEQLSATVISGSPLQTTIRQALDYVVEWKERVQSTLIPPTQWADMSAPEIERCYLKQLLAMFFEPILLRIAPAAEIVELRAHIWGFVTERFLASCSTSEHKPTLEELEGMLAEGLNLPDPAPAVAQVVQTRTAATRTWINTAMELKYLDLTDDAMREMVVACDGLQVDMSADYCYARFRNHCLLRPALSGAAQAAAAQADAEAEAQAAEVYCWCREEDDGQPMVCCDRCQNWFHSSCVGIHRKSVLKTMKTFHCIACCDELGKNYPHSWQSDAEKLAVKLLKKTKRKMEIDEAPERQKPRANADVVMTATETPEVLKAGATVSSLSSSSTTLQPLDEAATDQAEVTANKPTAVADGSGVPPGAMRVPYTYPAAGFPYAMGAAPNFFYYPQYPVPPQSTALPVMPTGKTREPSQPLPAQPMYPATYPYLGYMMVPPVSAPSPVAVAPVPAASAISVTAESCIPAIASTPPIPDSGSATGPHDFAGSTS